MLSFNLPAMTNMSYSLGDCCLDFVIWFLLESVFNLDIFILKGNSEEKIIVEINALWVKA